MGGRGRSLDFVETGIVVGTRKVMWMAAGEGVQEDRASGAGREDMTRVRGVRWKPRALRARGIGVEEVEEATEFMEGALRGH